MKTPQEQLRALQGRDPRFGGLLNRATKLQRKFNFYFAQRQHNPIMSKDTQQMVAEHMCGVLAPKLAEAKEAMDKLNRELEEMVPH